MLKQGNDYAREREKALAEGLREVATELRMIDPADYIAFIRTEQFGNLRTLVNSSTEMYFKPGTISFGLSGEADVTWDSEPVISLDMEFHHLSVSAYFRLILRAVTAGIEISYVQFESSSQNPDENTQRLVDAIADARIAPRKREMREAVSAAL